MDPVLKECPTAPSSRRRATAVGEANARIAVLGSENLDSGVYPTAGPCISASFQRILGLSRGLQLHGVPPLQWLEQWGRKTERPPYRDPLLHFHAPRLVALRGGDRNEGKKKRNRECERNSYWPRLRTCTQPTQLFAAGASLQPTPSPLCELV